MKRLKRWLCEEIDAARVQPVIVGTFLAIAIALLLLAALFGGVS